MNIKLTFINQNEDKQNNKEYNVIIEKDNGDKIFTKYTDDLEKLLNQKILVENIKSKQNNIYKKITETNIALKDDKRIIKNCIIYPLLYALCFKFGTMLLFNDIIVNSILNIPIMFSTAVTIVLGGTVISVGTLLAIGGYFFEYKKHQKELNSLNAQKDYLYDLEQKETEKLEDLEQKITLEKNCVKLETKTIDAKEELEKLKEELIFYYNQRYYLNDKKNEISEAENKQLLKRKDDNNG